MFSVPHMARNLVQHSRKRPRERVGLPNASQKICVPASVSERSAVSHTGSSMPEASSMKRKIRPPMLCRPWKASRFDTDQGTASMRQRFCSANRCSGGRPSPLAKIAVAVTSNQWRYRQSPCHLTSSGQVFVRSCVSVLAVTTPRQ
jgi:hypothetical protein